MDIKAKITEIADKIKNDKSLGEKFKKDPIKTVESLLGIDLPDEMISKVVDGVKAKLAGGKDDGNDGGLGGVVGKIKNLF